MYIDTLSLSQFRSYEQLSLPLNGQSLYLFGPNGAGKTNILEAISVLNPGRGLRGAGFSDLGRKVLGEATSHPWAVALKLSSSDDDMALGTGADPRDPSKRLVRLDGQSVTPARLLDHLRLVWLTPAQDRIFIEARSERLKFFDRLVFADQPSHAKAVLTYEKTLRERFKLLTQGPMDEAWLDVLEHRLCASGLEIMAARQTTLTDLQGEINAHQSAFPKADLKLISPFELSEADLATQLGEGFKKSRSRDAAAGRSLFGPHRFDLEVMHRDKARHAKDGSTGEQKALVLNMILAQGARLTRRQNAPKPILLLDEVAAHLDPLRRHALFDETTHLGLQTLYTGTDAHLFDGLKSRALGIRIEASQAIEFLR